MHPSRACLIIGIMLVCVTAAWRPAMGQDALPSNVTQVDGPLNDEQRRAIDGYLARWSFMADDSAASITEKRNKLREPLVRPGPTSSFKAQYSSQLATALESSLKTEKPAVRLNAMIVVGSLDGTFGLDMAVRHFADGDASVRYWAAKVVTRLAQQTLPNSEQPVLSEAQRRDLLKAISSRVNVEPWAAVRASLYQALAGLKLVDARITLAQALDTWVSQYVQQSMTADIKAEAAALARLYTELLQAYVKADDKAAVMGELKSLVIVGYKYALLIQRDINSIIQDPATLAVARDMVGSIELLLNQTAKIFDPSAEDGPPIAQPISNGEYKLFAFNVGEWLGKLTAAPLAIPANLLQLPPRLEQPAPSAVAEDQPVPAN